MKVKTYLRDVNIKGQTPIYVEYYLGGKRKRKSTGMFLYAKPKNSIEREHNRSTKVIEQTFISQLTIKLQNEELGIRTPKKKIKDFVLYVTEIKNLREETGVNFQTWKSTLLHLKKFAPNGLPFSNLNRDWLEMFKHFLVSSSELSSNSAQSYFNIIKHAIHDAFRDRLIDKDFAEFVSSPKGKTPIREYLTEEEIEKLKNTECANPILKKAFLFSCYTGMSKADIMKICWKDLKTDHNGNWQIVFYRKKTKGLQYHPISDLAREFLGEAQEKDDLIFTNFRYSAWMNKQLMEWVFMADIRKKITFHCARHSYATLLLHKGVPITTVQAMLGHNDVKTTMIYAKVMSEDKVNAAKLLNF